MKKILALILAAVMLLSLAACGGNENKNENENENKNNEITAFCESLKESISNAEWMCGFPEKLVIMTIPADSADSAKAVDVLTNIYNSYADPDNRPALGGGSGDTVNWEGPGEIAATDVDTLTGQLHVPAELTASITDAASAMFMMNANSLTAAAFRVNDSYVIMVYGLAGVSDPEFGDFLTPFTTALTTAYPTATLVVEQDLM